MSTISDYSSVLEIGFGLNAAASYVGVFINPSLTSARAELDRFVWWVEHPDRALPNMAESTTLEECEDKLVSWEQAYDNLSRKVKRLSQWPIGFCIAAAVGCFLLLLVPDVPVNAVGLFFVSCLVFAPSVVGALFVWFASRRLRRRERTKAQRAKDLFR